MIGVALYMLVVGEFMSVAAWLTERILASVRWARRGAWAAAMLLSVAIPAWRLPGALPDISPLQVSAPQAVPAPVRAAPTASQTQPIAGRAELNPARDTPPIATLRATHRFWSATVYQRAALLFLVGWSLASALLLARLLVGAATLQGRARQWAETVLDGVAVGVSDDLGPAVLGLLRPRIIVPRWLLAESTQSRAAVLVHENEHLRARDAYVVLGGWLLIVLMPWNFPLWWLWRRLRLAVEVDCDARVVRRGVPAASYGEELLAIATRMSAAPHSTLGLFEHRSQSAHRIRILVSPSRHWWRWAALPLYAFAGLASLAAGTFPAAPIDAALGARNQSQQTAHQLAALRAEERRATRRLLASDRPDALAAAAILGWPIPDAMPLTHGRIAMRKAPSNAAHRLAWLSRAVSEAPARVDLVILERDYCQAWRSHCELAELDARLRALDPHNGLGWLDALDASVKADKPAAIDAALAAIGKAKRVDVYGTHLFARLVDALHGIGGEDVASASEQLHGIGNGGMWLNAMIAFARVCNGDPSALSARRLRLCRNATVAFEQGDTFWSAASGSAIAMHLWPAGTLEHHQAALVQRRLDYLTTQSGRIWWPTGGLQRLAMLLDIAIEPRGYLERMDALNVRMDARYPRKQDVLRAELIHAGLRVSPPPRWQDPNN